MTFEIIPNPAYAGEEPRMLQPDCHDKSAFLTVEHGCGHQMHLHETQLAPIPPGCLIIATRCHGCGAMFDLDLARLFGAFKQMRDEGWIE